MSQKDVFRIIKKLNEAVRHQQGRMSPDSNGHGHGRLLQTIADNEGLSGAELALILKMSPPVISDKLTSLEDEGMIRRERDRKDRRKNHVYITHDGIMALARRKYGQERFQTQIGACLTESEQEQFCDMCSRIIQSIQELEVQDRQIDESVIISFYEEQKTQRRKKEKQQLRRKSEGVGGEE